MNIESSMSNDHAHSIVEFLVRYMSHRNDQLNISNKLDRKQPSLPSGKRRQELRHYSKR